MKSESMKNKRIILAVIVVLVGLGSYLISQNNSSALSQQSSDHNDATDRTTQTTSVGTAVGDKAPDFAYITIDGKKVESASLVGRVIVITSSSAWCPTCIMEAQQFSPVYQKYKDEPVVFITVDIDPRNTTEAINRMKQDTNTPWDYTNSEGGFDITQKFGFDRFEITYVIDQQGMIRFEDRVITSTEVLDQELQKLL